MTQPSFTSGYRGTPYLTYGEYMGAPTALDISELQVNGGVQAQQNVMHQLIAEASGWVDNICHQILTATVDVEASRVRVNRDGEIAVVTRYFPVLEVLDFQIGGDPNMLQRLSDLTSVWLEENTFIVTTPSFGASTNGPLQFGSPYGYGSGRLFARWAYVNGYPNTLLATGTYTAGTSSITVQSATGVYGGPLIPTGLSLTPPSTMLTIVDPDYSKTEQVSVASVAGNVLTLNAPLQFSHTTDTSVIDQQISVSALPPIVKKATVLLVNSLIETRGDGAMVAPSIAQGGYNVRQASGRIPDISDENQLLAIEWLQPYTVVEV